MTGLNTEILQTIQSRIDGYADEFNTTYTAWTNAIQAAAGAGAGKATASSQQAAVDDVLRRWRQFTNELKAQSGTVLNNEASMGQLEQLLAQVAEERLTLATLRGEAVTRTDQADSLQPRIRDSPYTNILGLRRVFRPETWNALLGATILFGILALVLGGIMVWMAVTAVTGGKGLGGTGSGGPSFPTIKTQG